MPFSPTDITGCKLWLEADAGVYKDAGSTLAGNGDAVQQWNDQSGNGNNVTQATSGNRPTFATAVVNGLPSVRFSASASQFFDAGAPLSGATAGSLFVALKRNSSPPADGTSAGFMQWSTADAAPWYPWTDGHIYESFGTTARKDTGAASGLATFRIYAVIAAASDWTNFLDGTQQFHTTSNTVAFKTSGSTVGKSSDGGATGYFDGDIVEVILYDSALSSTDRASVTTYLAQKYGITAALSLGNRVTQVAVEGLQLPVPSARVTQVAVEGLQLPVPSARFTQIVAEVLAPNLASSPPAARGIKPKTLIVG